MNIIFNSIGKKIFIIIVFAVTIIAGLVFLSLNCFDKISRIAGITQSGLNYEIMVNHVSMGFDRYVSNSSEDNYQKVLKMVTELSYTDGQIGSLYRLLKEGNSIDLAVKIYREKTGDPQLTYDKSIGIIQMLMGTRILEKLSIATDRAHNATKAWKRLIEQYHEKKDAEARKKIAAQFESIEKQMPELLKAFHSSMEEVANYFSGKIIKIFIIISLVAITLISTIAFLITRSITGPLQHTVKFVELVSKGNFKETLNIKSSDELGKMANTMNNMSSNLRDMIKEIIHGIEQLNMSAGHLTKISDKVSGTALDNDCKANTVSVAAEEMSSNMSIVAKNMEISALKTDAVVVAVEEMTNTINEIGKNSEVAKMIIDKAETRSKSASEQMNQLGRVAGAIGNVTEAILDISEQTKLLSLNATIEAARAGEAGKGFTVVANEIKELAKQTDNSTHDIKKQIEEIQSSTKVSMEEINEIASVISKTSLIVATVATSVEEQSIATREIAQNISIVSEGTSDVNNNIAESSAVANEITQSIEEIHQSTDEMKNSSSQAKDQSKRLSELASNLNKMMKQFTV